MLAAGTAIQVAAERSRATALDGAQHAQVLPTKPGSILFNKALARRADNIGHLKGWLLHLLCSLRERFTCSGPASSSLSIGVPAAFKCRSDRCR